MPPVESAKVKADLQGKGRVSDQFQGGIKQLAVRSIQQSHIRAADAVGSLQRRRQRVATLKSRVKPAGVPLSCRRPLQSLGGHTLSQ